MESQRGWTKEDVRCLTETIKRHGIDNLELLRHKGGRSLRGRANSDIHHMCKWLVETRKVSVPKSPRPSTIRRQGQGKPFQARPFQAAARKSVPAFQRSPPASGEYGQTHSDSVTPEASSSLSKEKKCGPAGNERASQRQPQPRATKEPEVIEISSGSEPSSSSSSYSSYYSSESEYSEENSSEASEVALSSAATDATGVVTISSQSSNPSSVSGKEDSCESEEEERKRKDEGDDGDEEEETRVGNNAETFGERRDVPATTSDKGDAKDAKEVFLSPEQKIKESKEFHEADQEEWRRRNEVIRQQSLKAKIERKRKKESNLRVEKRLKEFKTQRAEEKQAISDADVLRPQVRTMINHVTRGSMHFPTVMQRLGLHNFPQAGAFGIGGCSKAEITKIYRKTILKYHPDRNQNLPLREKIRNEEIFKVVQTAYEAYK